MIHRHRNDEQTKTGNEIGGETVTHSDKEMWRINIENDADKACSIYGADTVSGVFARYDSTSFDDLSPSYYEEVFGDLELMINDN